MSDLLLGNVLLASALALLAAAAAVLRASPRTQHALWTLVLVALLTPPVLGWEVPLVRWTAPLTGFAPARAVLPRLGELGAGWLGLWALHACAVLAVQGVRLARLRRLLTASAPPPSGLAAEARRVARDLGLARDVPIRLVPAAISPCVFGLGPWARILLPARLVERLPREERRLVLAHELVHVLRGDPWVRALELLCTVLYGWFPLLWWARRRLRMLEELCCDAEVVARYPAQRRAYARALLDTVDLLAPAGARAFSPAARELRSRLLALQERRAVPGSGATRLATLGVALALPFAPRPVLERWTVIRATDPAGAFTVEFAGERVATLTVDGRPWPAGRWRQEDGRLSAWRNDGSSELELELAPGGRGFRWEARSPRDSRPEVP